MIDFRYHLVSLVSVFLALAVGIVLGAGPLKEPIASELLRNAQLARQEGDSLRDQLKTAQAGTVNRDTFLGQLEPGLVAGQLPGRSVAVVTLPGTDTDLVQPLTTALTQAGARVTGRLAVTQAWADPANRAARDRAVAALQAAVPTASPTGSPGGTGGSSPSASGPARPSTPATPAPPGTRATPGSAAAPDPAGDAAAAALLARALLTTDTGTTAGGGKPDAAARGVLDGLARAGLVDLDGDVAGHATQAVLLVPGVVQAVQGAAPTPAPTGAADPVPTWVTLARALDTASTGAVVVGPASAATAGGGVAAVRAQPQLAATLSTVDTGATPMGDVTTVFALQEQQGGGAGNYGFGDGAKAPMPTRSSGGS